MNCNIIKDLMPSYMDEICSEETAKAVEEHIEHCEKCQQNLQMMKQPTNNIQVLTKEVTVAKEPFKQINKKRRIQVLIAVMITFMMTIIGAWIVQDVGVVNDIFFPDEWGIATVPDDKEEWEGVKFNDQNYIIFDSIFWRKAIVNHANNEKNVLVRVKDDNDNIVIDAVQVPAGTSVKLEGLKRHEKYYIEIKAPQGKFTINAI
ncbi:zf-HC2 domain-containing protein [Lysinibacillus irui]|uniref:zf-HC2 domain-containing protein n=1 Tax=Lysinibacillus irui TaxID=2998077 RepID=UPI002AD2896A|nr:zf-HC2 domain-containing protein [Lysinibacillus irui]MEA0562294.1 zf-HC2 domain-containing protein [Lysinibacillus irui]